MRTTGVPGELARWPGTRRTFPFDQFDQLFENTRGARNPLSNLNPLIPDILQNKIPEIKILQIRPNRIKILRFFYLS